MEEDRRRYVAEIMRHIRNLNELVVQKDISLIRIMNKSLIDSIKKQVVTLVQLSNGITQADLEPLPELFLKQVDLIFRSLFDFVNQTNIRDIPNEEGLAMLRSFDAVYNELFEHLLKIKGSMTNLLNVTLLK